MRSQLAAAIALALLTAACGSPSDLPEVTSDADDVILRVDEVGGLAPVEFVLAAGPRYVLSGDRRLINEGPQIAIFPGPMLPNYQAVQLNEQDVTDVLEAVVATGLPEIDMKLDDTANTIVADAPTTVVTFHDSNGRHVFGVYAIGIGEFDDPQVGPLQDLLFLLDELASTRPAEPYQTDRVQVIATPAQLTGQESEEVGAWPIEASPAAFEPLARGFGCAVFEGEEGRQLLDAFSQAHQLTLWEVNGDIYRVVARQLLPGEEGCQLPT